MQIIFKIRRFLKVYIEIIHLTLKFIFYDVLWNTIKKTLFWGTPATALCIAYLMIIKFDKVHALGIYVLTPLAILIAFSSLLYGRARAVESEAQSVCLASADRVFLGSIYYLVALVWAFVVTTIVIMLKEDFGSNLFNNQILTLIYIPTFLALIKAYFKLIEALSLIWPYLKKSQKN